MARKVNRHDTLAQLKAIERNLLAIQSAVSTLIADLHVGIHQDTTREVRNYDVPTQDAEAIAEMHGIDLYAEDTGTPPEWFKDKYGHYTEQGS